MTLTVESWCEALESGKYKQAQNALRNEDEDGVGHCCLGVACDLSALGYWSGDRYTVDGFRFHLVDLPRPVQSLLKLSTDSGQFRFSDLPGDLKAELQPFKPHEYNNITLADLNDEGCPFPLIAKVIRARPKGLFREDAT